MDATQTNLLQTNIIKKGICQSLLNLNIKNSKGTDRHSCGYFTKMTVELLNSRLCWISILLSLFSNILTRGTVTVSPVSLHKRKVEILKNTGINVNYGRATELTGNNLKVGYEKSSTCRISVKKVNPFSTQIGAFIPSEFPCDFKPGSVYYQHYGSMSRNKETVKLQVRVDIEEETIFKMVEINVCLLYTSPSPRDS